MKVFVLKQEEEKSKINREQQEERERECIPVKIPMKDRRSTGCRASIIDTLQHQQDSGKDSNVYDFIFKNRWEHRRYDEHGMTWEEIVLAFIAQ